MTRKMESVRLSIYLKLDYYHVQLRLNAFKESQEQFFVFLDLFLSYTWTWSQLDTSSIVFASARARLDSRPHYGDMASPPPLDVYNTLARLRLGVGSGLSLISKP